MLVADTNVIDMPSAEELADIVQLSRFGARCWPKSPCGDACSADLRAVRSDLLSPVREAARILDSRNVDFEYDGEMAVDVALNREARGVIRSAACRNR